uniref:Uncharacterized protein n=1 Tax=Arundo donax TaxID=35708 RepID=A0A0A9AKQ8_ARUDO
MPSSTIFSSSFFPFFEESIILFRRTEGDMIQYHIIITEHNPGLPSTNNTQLSIANCFTPQPSV